MRRVNLKGVALAAGLALISLSRAQTTETPTDFETRVLPLLKPNTSFAQLVVGLEKDAANRNEFSRRMIMQSSRSLDRAETSFTRPRSISVIGTQVGSSTGGFPKIYLGHHTAKDTAEVIAWNQVTGRYEFLLVKDLYHPQKAPTVTRADRALCATCHQHGGPIFTHGPIWSESINGDLVRATSTDKLKKLEELKSHVSEVLSSTARKLGISEPLISATAKKIREIQKDENVLFGHPSSWIQNEVRAAIAGLATSSGKAELKESFRRELRDELSFSPFWEHEQRSILDSANSFDEGVRNSARAIQARALCDGECGSSPKCMGAMLTLAIGNALDLPFGSPEEKTSVTEQQITNDLAKFIEELPKSVREQPSSALPDRETTQQNPDGVTALYLLNTPAKLKSATTSGVVDSFGEEEFIGRTHIINYFEPNSSFVSPKQISGVRTLSIQGINAAADPSKPRPPGLVLNRSTALHLARGAIACFAIEPSQLEPLKGTSLTTIYGAIQKGQATKKILSSPSIATVNGQLIISAIQNDIQSSQGEAIECLPGDRELISGATINGMAPVIEIVRKQAETPESDQRAKALLRKYCADCHSPGTLLPLALEDLNAIRTYRDDEKRSASDRIQSGSMPRGEHARVITPEERDFLIDYLAPSK